MTIYLLDSHSYSPDEKRYPGYDWIKSDQIDWFRATTKARKKARDKHGIYGHLNLAFIHIPLPEYRGLTERVGSRGEDESSPTLNSHFKDALVDGKVQVVSCGHDHVNDYCALSRNTDSHPELWMCYAGGSGFGGYGGDGYVRRVRVFETDSQEGLIRTWKRLEWGDMDKRLEEQVIVISGSVVAH